MAWGDKSDLPHERVHDYHSANDTAVPAKGHGAEASLLFDEDCQQTETTTRRWKPESGSLNLGTGAKTYTAGEDKDPPVVDLYGIIQHGIVLDDLAEKRRHGCGGVGVFFSRWAAMKQEEKTLSNETEGAANDDREEGKGRVGM